MRSMRIILIIIILFLMPFEIFGVQFEFHDDGIESYTHTEQLQNYMKTLSPELKKTLFAQEEAIQWWKDAKFGVFMHWDPCSQLGCAMSWGRKGRRPGHPSDGKVTKGIPTETYDSQYKTFNPVKFNADEWIKMVKDSGAKYLIFTAKHHAGFCMFDSKVSDYDIMNTPFKRDVAKELSDACHKYGIKLFWYYSQPDWHHPDYMTDRHEKYVQEYLYPQIKELLTQYGKLGGIWFDGLGMAPETWHTAEMLKMMRDIQPQILVNHRISRPQWRMGDFDGPERRIGRFQINRPWETCTIIGGGWGWSGDKDPMSFDDAIGLLVRCAGNGGNLALNTGPSPEGFINPKHAARYREMGTWLKKYGDSIYGTSSGPYIPGPWGVCTSKGNKIFLHILGQWSGKKFSLPALPAKIKNAQTLTGGKVKVEQKSGSVNISMAQKDINTVDTVIELTLDKKAGEITPIKTIGPSLTFKAKASASSETDKNKAQSVVASDAKEFSEGIYIKSAWKPGSKDKEPWIAIDLGKPQQFQQIRIREGKKFDTASKIESFVVEIEEGGKWKKIFKGTQIGGGYGLILDEPVKASKIRIRFLKFGKGFSINTIEAF